MKSYHVTVKRTEWREAEFTVSANSRAEAEVKARDVAANHDFSNANSSEADYEVVNVRSEVK